MNLSQSMANIVTSLVSAGFASLLLAVQPAAGQEMYQAILTPGGNEIIDPSAGFGVATLAVVDDVVIYAVWLHNVERVTAVRIHDVSADDSATIVRLYQGRETGRVEGKFTGGWFRANAVKKMPWDDFLLAMEVGRLTVEVDLRDSPWGSLIGQLQALDASDDSLVDPRVVALHPASNLHRSFRLLTPRRPYRRVAH